MIRVKKFDPPEYDQDGFMILKRREDPIQELLVVDEDGNYIEYIIRPALKSLSHYYDKVLNGKYPKMDKEDSIWIYELIGLFKQSLLKLCPEQIFDAIRMLIIIGKS